MLQAPFLRHSDASVWEVDGITEQVKRVELNKLHDILWVNLIGDRDVTLLRSVIADFLGFPLFEDDRAFVLATTRAWNGLSYSHELGVPFERDVFSTQEVCLRLHGNLHFSKSNSLWSDFIFDQ